MGGELLTLITGENVVSPADDVVGIIFQRLNGRVIQDLGRKVMQILLELDEKKYWFHCTSVAAKKDGLLDSWDAFVGTIARLADVRLKVLCHGDAEALAPVNVREGDN